MVSTAALEVSALQRFAHLSKFGNAEPWLTVQWSPEESKLVYGCNVCKPLLDAKKIKMPHRYVNPSKSRAFAHSNVTDDVKRAIPMHAMCQTHKKALEIIQRNSKRLRITVADVQVALSSQGRTLM